MTTATTDAGTDHAATAVLEVAERFHAMSPDWVVFFQDVLGVEGIVRRTFSSPEALIRFECSPQYARIREMLDDLRDRRRDQPVVEKPLRVVTVRMPTALHKTLKAEADQMRVSINNLCIAKLMKLVDADLRRDLTAETGSTPDEKSDDTPKKRTGADL